MVLHSLPSGQQRRVVAPASIVHVVLLGQQKLAGRFACGHCKKPAAQDAEVSDVCSPSMDEVSELSLDVIGDLDYLLPMDFGLLQ